MAGDEDDGDPVRQDEKVEDRAAHADARVRGAHMIGLRARHTAKPAGCASRDLDRYLARSPVGIVDEPIQDNRCGRPYGELGLIQKLKLRCAGVRSADVLIREHSIAAIERTVSSGQSARDLTFDGDGRADVSLCERRLDAQNGSQAQCDTDDRAKRISL